MTEAATTGIREIIDGISDSPARIAPKYFYDARGSALFEEITRLPEYYPTRTEGEIMSANGADIAQKLGAGGTVIELGAGSCEKARSLCQLIRPATFVAIDISTDFLHDAVAGLRQTFPALDIRVVAADLTVEIPIPPDIGLEQRMVFYPGSSIGNFDPPHALNLLSRVRDVVNDEGALLIGVDLLKDVGILEAAYDDTAGVTAAFNLNVLGHINRIIGSDFDDRQWRHRAFFNAGDSRIEMHLEAACDCLVSWPSGARRFLRGERIHTENSYKYRRETFIELLAGAGFPHTDVWTDARNWFAVILARP